MGASSSGVDVLLLRVMMFPAAVTEIARFSSDLGSLVVVHGRNENLKTEMKEYRNTTSMEWNYPSYISIQFSMFPSVP